MKKIALAAATALAVAAVPALAAQARHARPVGGGGPLRDQRHGRSHFVF